MLLGRVIIANEETIWSQQRDFYARRTWDSIVVLRKVRKTFRAVRNYSQNGYLRLNVQ